MQRADPFDAEFTPVAPGTPPPLQAPPGTRLVPRTPPDPRRVEEVERAPIETERARVGLSTDVARQSVVEREPVRNLYQDESALRTAFERLPSVQSYVTVVPQYISARQAADTRAGDLNLIYAFGKIMDPGSVVREGEMVMAQGTGAVTDRLRGVLGELDRRGRLSPATRADLLAELRTRRQQLATSYNQARGQYEGIAREYGFRPENVVGEHPAAPYTNVDEQRGGTADPRPDVGYVPWAQAAPPQTDNPLSPEQQAAYDAFSRANPHASPGQIAQFFSGIGMTIHNADEIVRARDAGEGGNPVAAGAAAHYPPPDISSMRGGQPLEAVDATLRQASNSATFGLADVVSAGVDAATTDRTFSESLRREHAIDAYDFREHPGYAISGSVAGGVALPTGALGAARSAATAARLAGAAEAEVATAARAAAANRLALEGGGYGFVHGAADADGDMSQRIANAVMESAIGATTGYAAGRILPSGAGRSPSPREPLVDPVTERLNQPLEDVTSAERVASARDFGIDLPMGAAGGRTAAILERGLDIVPPSAGVMEDARRGTSSQVEQAVEGVGARYGPSRTLFSAGQALQRGAKNWISRFQRVASQAYERIPIPPGISASLTNTRAALTNMLDVFRSNPDMRRLFQNSRLRAYLEALTPPHEVADEFGVTDPLAGVMRTAGRGTTRPPGDLSWQDLKHFRSIIGEEIGEVRFSDSPARSQLRALYAALSEDMRVTATTRGPRALRAFERANNLYSRGEQRIEQALVSILGDDSRNNPEAAARAIQTIARSGRGTSNIQQLAQIRASLSKGDEWDDVAGTLIRLGGQPAQSQGREFNPQTFVQWYSDMSEPARNLLFGDRGRRELRQALDDFVAVNQRLAGSNALRNTSNTAPGITAAGAVTGLGAVLFNPLLGIKLAGVAGINYGMARLWTNPGFVRWATGYTRMLRGAAHGAPSAGAVSRQRGYLMRLARSQPGIAADVAGLEQILFGDESTASPGTTGSEGSR